ncbi:hypothetical protein HK105_205119 [Polyrhizophydium stewartii]|uniref:Uncharacterized protein n=1 Tax=Polyrhizophydium stewartii TaxID=2732419 RepID=A0ABR4N712_9FUNG
MSVHSGLPHALCNRSAATTSWKARALLSTSCSPQSARRPSRCSSTSAGAASALPPGPALPPAIHLEFSPQPAATAPVISRFFGKRPRQSDPAATDAAPPAPDLAIVRSPRVGLVLGHDRSALRIVRIADLLRFVAAPHAISKGRSHTVVGLVLDAALHLDAGPPGDLVLGALLGAAHATASIGDGRPLPPNRAARIAWVARVSGARPAKVSETVAALRRALAAPDAERWVGAKPPSAAADLVAMFGSCWAAMAAADADADADSGGSGAEAEMGGAGTGAAGHGAVTAAAAE